MLFLKRQNVPVEVVLERPWLLVWPSQWNEKCFPKWYLGAPRGLDMGKNASVFQWVFYTCGDIFKDSFNYKVVLSLSDDCGQDGVFLQYSKTAMEKSAFLMMDFPLYWRTRRYAYILILHGFDVFFCLD